MRLPKEINVLGYIVKIKYRKKILITGEECFGYYDTETRTIYLLSGLKPIRRREVFLHEFIHSVVEIACMKMSHENVNLMALCFLQLLNTKRVKL